MTIISALILRTFLSLLPLINYKSTQKSLYLTVVAAAIIIINTQEIRKKEKFKPR